MTTAIQNSDLFYLNDLGTSEFITLFNSARELSKINTSAKVLNPATFNKVRTINLYQGNTAYRRPCR